MQEAMDVLLEGMPEKGFQLDQAETIDKLRRCFKRFTISIKTDTSKQKILKSCFFKRNKGKEFLDSVELLSDTSSHVLRKNDL